MLDNASEDEFCMLDALLSEFRKHLIHSQTQNFLENTIKHNISCLGVDENLSNVDFVHGKSENS